VLVMMVVQRLGRHVRLKRFVVIRQGREFEGHGYAPAKFAEWGKKSARKLKVPSKRSKPSR